MNFLVYVWDEEMEELYNTFCKDRDELSLLLTHFNDDRYTIRHIEVLANNVLVMKDLLKPNNFEHGGSTV